MAVAAAALVAAVAAAVLIGLPRASGPEAVGADGVLRRALSAVSSGRTWQADVMLKGADWNRSGIGYHYDVTRYHVVQSADGSYLLERIGRTRRLGSGESEGRRVTDVVAYDAATGTRRHLRPERGLSVTRNAALGPPDRWASPLTGVDFGAALRALQAMGAVRLEQTEIDGRRAWTVTCTQATPVVFPSASASASAQDADWPVFKVTVDSRTWLPVRFQRLDAGILTAELRTSHLRVDKPLPAGAFVPRASRGLSVSHADGGFRRIRLEEAGAFGAAMPVVPGFVAGYKLTGVAVAARALTANHLVRGEHVFVLQYAHGFDALTVSTRRIADPYYSATEDPVDSYDPGWSELVRAEAPITSGAFAGATASIVVATTSSSPHLWAVKDGVLLTIAGGANARELLEIADHLQPYPSPSSSPD